MAGVKFTDLPTSGELQKTDITCIVDVTDNTSKQATIQDVVNAVDQLSITDVDGQAMIIAEESVGIKVQSDNAAFLGLYYRTDYSANYIPESLITRADAPKIFVLDGKPTNTSTIPSNYGDIYFDKLGGSGYFATGISSDTDWEKLNDFSASQGTPTEVLPISVHNITLTKSFYSWIDGYVSVKGKITLDFNNTVGHFVSFKITLPVQPVNDFTQPEDIIGSIVPNTLGLTNSEVDYTIIHADVGSKVAYIFLHVKNSVTGSCDFVYDFGYFA